MKLQLATLLFALSLGAGCGSSGVVHGTGSGGSSAGGAAGSAGSAGAGGIAGDSGVDSGQAGTSGGGAATTDLSIIIEPSDKGAALEKAVEAAQKSVHMTMYLLTNFNIINALISQHQAGHDVRVVLNQNFYGSNGNLNAYTQLSNAGVPVHWAPSGFNYTHEKCVIVDGQQAWIMTMNAAYSSPRDNREYLAIDRDPADIAEADSINQADFNGQTATVSGKLLVAPVNARPQLKALIDNAKQTLDMEAEELSDYVLVGALDAAADRGVQVHIVIATGSTSTAQAKAVQNLKSHGVKLVALDKPYVHAKSLVADAARAYVGSENFTQNSLTQNRELGVIFTTPSEVQKVLTATHGDFANGTPQ